MFSKFSIGARVLQVLQGGGSCSPNQVWEMWHPQCLCTASCFDQFLTHRPLSFPLLPKLQGFTFSQPKRKSCCNTPISTQIFPSEGAAEQRETTSKFPPPQHSFCPWILLHPHRNKVLSWNGVKKIAPGSVAGEAWVESIERNPDCLWMF